MNRIALIFILSCFFVQLNAQIYDPVKWSFSWNKVSDTEADLIFTAKIQDGWYTYSQFMDGDGPVPTSFEFDPGKHFAAVGKVKESGKIAKEFDKNFDMELVKIKEKGTFTQRIKVTDASKPITGWLTFMTCDATKCLPPKDVEFSFDISKMVAAKKEAPKKEEKPEEEPVKKEIERKVEKPSPEAKDNTSAEKSAATAEKQRKEQQKK